MIRASSLNEFSWKTQIEQWQHRLASHAQPVVGVITHDPLFIALLLQAVSRINKCLLPISLHMPRARQLSLLKQAGCRLLFSDEPLPDWPPGFDCQQIEALPDLPHQFQPISGLCDETDKLRLLLATSGSSGEPKGVMLSSAALAANAGAVNQALSLQANDLWLNCLPLYHIGGLSILYRCALAGAEVLLSGFDAQQTWSQMQDFSISHISLVPVMLSKLLDVSNDSRPPASLRVALVGGAPLTQQLARRAHDAGWPLAVSYGMSETSSACALDFSADAGLHARRVGSVLPGFEIDLDERDQAIRLRGAALMSGYLNQKLILAQGMDNGWFNTGDAGFFDDTGQLCISGRLDDVLISGGKNIHPREVEQMLETVTGVGHVAVTSRHDPRWGERLVALYERDFVDAAALHEHAEKLPSYLCPREFVAVDALPFSTMGKLDRKQLRQMLESSGN